MLLAVCGFFPNKFLILKSIILENVVEKNKHESTNNHSYQMTLFML